MPEIGEYWYDQHGGPEVVRVVAVDDERCTFLIVNSVLRPSSSIEYERLAELTLEDFANDYQRVSAVHWLSEGSTWFDRSNASRIVTLDEDSDVGDPVFFRERRREDLGPIERLRYEEFIGRFVRVDNGIEDRLTTDRFWVVGNGICAAFVSEIYARAFIFEVCALLSMVPGSLQIHRIAYPGSPFTNHGVGFVAAGGLPGLSTTVCYSGGVAGGGGGAGGGEMTSHRGVGAGGIAGSNATVSVVIPKFLERESPTLWERLDGDDPGA